MNKSQSASFRNVFVYLNQKNSMALFYGWGLTVSRLQRHYHETVLFLEWKYNSNIMAKRLS